MFRIESVYFSMLIRCNIILFKCKSYAALIDSLMLKQFIHKIMWNDNILDLLFTNDPDLIDDMSSTKDVYSDHNIIKVTFKFTNIKF